MSSLVFWLYAILLLLTACRPEPAAVGIPTPSAEPTQTFPTPYPSDTPTRPSSSTPPPTPTSKPEAPPLCDPFIQAFCIESGPFPLLRPIRPPANDAVEPTYRFASTANGMRDVHHGVEFVNPSGTPVYAAAAGEVIFDGPDRHALYSPWRNFYGNLVVLRHSLDLFTFYAHLSAIDVQAGHLVAAGEPIGRVGATGGALGSHLHFEVRLGQATDYHAAVNPELWMQPRAGEGVLVISVLDSRTRAFRPARLTVQTQGRTYFLRTYEAIFPQAHENAALGDLPEGEYRVVCQAGAGLHERRVEVKSGKLTRVIFLIP